MILKRQSLRKNQGVLSRCRWSAMCKFCKFWSAVSAEIHWPVSRWHRLRSSKLPTIMDTAVTFALVGLNVNACNWRFFPYVSYVLELGARTGPPETMNNDMCNNVNKCTLWYKLYNKFKTTFWHVQMLCRIQLRLLHDLLSNKSKTCLSSVAWPLWSRIKKLTGSSVNQLR